MTRLITIAILAGALVVPASSSAHPSYPVMACMDFMTGLSHQDYAPSGRCYLEFKREPEPGLVDEASISHTRWEHWGTKTATGRGNVTFYGGPPVTVPATMTAYGLLEPRNSGASPICLLQGGAYSRLRVSWKRSSETRAGSHVFNVTPIDVGC